MTSLKKIEIVVKPCATYRGVDIYLIDFWYTVFLGPAPFKCLHPLFALDYIDEWYRLKLN